MKIKFDVTPKEFVIVRDILEKYLQSECKVWVFGGRAKSRSLVGSDLNLAIECDAKIELKLLTTLKIAFEDSRLPYRVDVVDMKAVKPYFKEIIDKERVLFPLNHLNKVPVLRFPEFSGEWEVKEFTDLVEKSKKRYNPETEDDIYPSIELESLSQGTGILLEIFNSKEQKSIKNKFKSGEILFGKLRPYLRKFFKATFDGVCSSEIWVFNGKKLDNIFLYYLIQINKFNYVANITSGSKMPRSDWEYLSNSPFFYPQLKEQQKIADFLTQIDRKIELLAKKKQLLETYKKGGVQQVFSQSLRFKDDNGNAYPDWEVKKLGDSAKSIMSGKTKADGTGKYFVYGSTGVIGKSIEYTHNGEYLLIARVGANAGKINKVSGKFSVTDNTLIFDSKTSVSIKFIYFLLIQFNLNRLVFGSGQPLITGGQLKSLKLNFPSIEEQTKIANFLTELDNKINLVKKQLSGTKEYKKGLLQQMFI